MKTLLLFVSVIALTVHYSKATDSCEDTTGILILAKELEDSVINDIRKKFRLINDNYSNYYLKVNKDLNEHSTEGGDIKAYYDDTKLRKVVASYFGETGRRVTDYYFWDNIIFFIFTRDFKYNSPIYTIEDNPEEGIEAYDESKTEVSENRYYFTEGKLIRWLDPDNNKLNINTPAFKAKQTELLKDVQFIRDNLDK